MTKKFHCDGPECTVIMSKDDWHIRVSVVEPPLKRIEHIHEDPDEALDFAREQVEISAELVSTLDLDWDGEKHFHSYDCYIMDGWRAREERQATEDSG